MKDVHIFLVATAAFDLANGAALRDVLNVGDRRAVKVDQFNQLKNALINI